MAVVDGLCTLAEARASLGWGDNDTANNSDLERYIEAATPLIEDEAGPMVARSRTFTLDGGRSTVMLPVKFNTVTSVVEDGNVITDYSVNAAAGLIFAGTERGARSFEGGSSNIVVTVTVGSATIPANVTLATRELVRHLWQMGRQGNRPAYGMEGVDIVPQGFAMPKRVLELLAPNTSLGGFA